MSLCLTALLSRATDCWISHLQWEIQQQLNQLTSGANSELLHKLAISCQEEEVENLPSDDITEMELFDFIFDFLRSKWLKSLEDQGMSRLLIGGRCMVNCYLDGVKLLMLLDSGTQASIVENFWVQKALPNVTIKPLESVLSDHPLKVTVTHWIAVPLDGWIEVLLEITSSKQASVLFMFPS